MNQPHRAFRRWIGIGALTLVVPLAASAQQAFTNVSVNLRAGPSADYPVVAVLGGGQSLEVMGCTGGYSWCDVVLPDGLRGWLFSQALDYAYEQQRVPLATYGAVIGVPIVTFALGNYWSNYYRDRPWYGDRRWWGSRPPPPVQGWRPPPPPRAEWRPNPWRPGPGGPGPGYRPRPDRPSPPGPGFRPPRDDGYRPRPDPGFRPGGPGPRSEVRPERPRPQPRPPQMYVRPDGGARGGPPPGAGRPDRGPREGGGPPPGRGGGGGERRGGEGRGGEGRGGPGR
ncbi:MAG: ligand-binding protein SH3 [Variovorax sp.]|nr:MAG: ligand-binding protein SH3 [Variovorax sp.]